MRNFWLDCFFATVFVFLFMWGIFKLTQLNVFNAFDSIGNALGDMEMTDYVFSGLRDDPKVEENVVVVNIGNLNRGQVAQLLQIINQHKPKVIGIDSFFDCAPTGLRDTVNCPQLKDTLGNLMLSNAIKEAGNVVLVSKLLQSDSLSNANLEDVYDSLERSDLAFTENALAEGYASLETDAAYQDDVKTCRAFNPQMTVNG
jgi:CHASE2 domain-containing sensor protein